MSLILVGCVTETNPLFVNPTGEDFNIMRSEAGYALDSTASLSTGGTDWGAYNEEYGFVRYPANITIYNLDVDISPRWYYPKLEIVEDYTGNVIKYVGKPRRIITIEGLQGVVDQRSISRIEKLYLYKKPIRFYPFGTEVNINIENDYSGVPYVIENRVSDSNLQKLKADNMMINEKTAEYDLVLDFSTSYTVNDINYTMIAYLQTLSEELGITITGDMVLHQDKITNISPSGSINGIKAGMRVIANNISENTYVKAVDVSNSTIYLTTKCNATDTGVEVDFEKAYFLDGYLKGFYLTVIDNSSVKHYYRIDENSENILFLTNEEEETFLTDGTYTCKVEFIYVTFRENPQMILDMWRNNATTGDIVKLELYELNDKFVEQI